MGPPARGRRARAALLAGGLGAALTAAVAGALAVVPAAQAAPAAAPAAPASPPGAGTGEQEPSAAQLAAQARADALHRRLRAETGHRDAARAALADAARTAADALETYRTAVQQQQQAQLDEAAAQARLERAMQAAAEQRSTLGRLAWHAYVNGGGLGDSPAVLTVLDGAPTDGLAVARALTRAAGDGEASALAALRAAQQAQEQALADAGAAQRAADEQAARAGTARTAADAAVARQRAALQQQERGLVATRRASDSADRQAELLTLADQYASVPSAAPPGAVGGANGSGALAGPVGNCAGTDLSAFPNGRIPLTLLCPVFGGPGKYLRADAAYAFDRLSHAYLAAFGTPVCVTDAYRSYDDQVRVAAERPGFAAQPGRSNHGWGTATDLCGGIESFGTPQHAWMLANAPLFGWFHPAWAEPGGSLPEAWHWEFGG